MFRDLSVVIQAGGRSSRMGRDKGLVPLAGRLMLEHVIDAIESLGDDIVITTNNRPMYAQFGLRMASDAEPGAGALPGLHTALSAAMGEYVLLVACDMPLLNSDLLRHQVELAFETGKDVVVPLWDGRHQPLHAVYKRESCLVAVEEVLALGEKRMISFYPFLNVLELPESVVESFSPNGRTFLNVNTPEELAALEASLGSG